MTIIAKNIPISAAPLYQKATSMIKVNKIRNK